MKLAAAIAVTFAAGAAAALAVRHLVNELNRYLAAIDDAEQG